LELELQWVGILQPLPCNLTDMSRGALQFLFVSVPIPSSQTQRVPSC